MNLVEMYKKEIDKCNSKNQQVLNELVELQSSIATKENESIALKAKYAENYDNNVIDKIVSIEKEVNEMKVRYDIMKAASQDTFNISLGYEVVKEAMNSMVKDLNIAKKKSSVIAAHDAYLKAIKSLNDSLSEVTSEVIQLGRISAAGNISSEDLEEMYNWHMENSELLSYSDITYNKEIAIKSELDGLFGTSISLSKGFSDLV